MVGEGRSGDKRVFDDSGKFQVGKVVVGRGSFNN